MPWLPCEHIATFTFRPVPRIFPRGAYNMAENTSHAPLSPVARLLPSPVYRFVWFIPSRRLTRRPAPPAPSVALSRTGVDAFLLALVATTGRQTGAPRYPATCLPPSHPFQRLPARGALLRAPLRAHIRCHFLALTATPFTYATLRYAPAYLSHPTPTFPAGAAFPPPRTPLPACLGTRERARHAAPAGWRFTTLRCLAHTHAFATTRFPPPTVCPRTHDYIPVPLRPPCRRAAAQALTRWRSLCHTITPYLQRFVVLHLPVRVWTATTTTASMPGRCYAATATATTQHLPPFAAHCRYRTTRLHPLPTPITRAWLVCTFSAVTR